MPTLSMPLVEPIRGQPLVRLFNALRWGHEDKGYSVMIPRGLYSDGSSVPNSGWPALKAKPIQMLIPGIIHDYLVRIGAEVVWDGEARELDAELAIEIMLDVMEWNGCCEWDRWAVKNSLELTASLYWQKKPVMWDGTTGPRF